LSGMPLSGEAGSINTFSRWANAVNCGITEAGSGGTPTTM
jgi:hypothetical protein